MKQICILILVALVAATYAEVIYILKLVIFNSEMTLLPISEIIQDRL